MGELILWAAEHLELLRPFAIAGLGLVAISCIWWALASWESFR